MIPKRYGPDEVSGLLLLLGSIGREIEERSRTLAGIEQRIEELSKLEVFDPEALRDLEAQAAVHRRQLRLTRQELARLGCSLLGTDPLTFRIPGRVGESKKSLVWQKGARLLKG